MPFDGIVVKNVVHELSQVLVGGRIDKIFQPEADEIIIMIRVKSGNMRLVLSANPNYPRIHITDIAKENPSVPPVFCMLLRKHLLGGRIIGFEFSDFERIVGIKIESINELGDMGTKTLLIEIMGRHSNIILINEDKKILDSIKHIDNEISSVREVMPGRTYLLPPAQNKISPAKLDIDGLLACAANSTMAIGKFLLNNIKGFSPLLCSEICFRAGIDASTHASSLDTQNVERISDVLNLVVQKISSNDFTPCIIFSDVKGEVPIDFHCTEITQYEVVKYFDTISTVLDYYYTRKDHTERLKQRKSDILKVLNLNIERCRKKLSMHEETIREVSEREKLRLYGELITANIYSIPANAKFVKALNYYSEQEEYIEIPLDQNLTPQENAQKYYKKYSKAKSSFANAILQVEDTSKELEYLENVRHNLESCSEANEIDEIREELVEQGYLKNRRKKTASRKKLASLPLHFKSSDGVDIYVGKNNRQNDMLTLKQSSSNDIWLHARNIPGSHVIVKKHDVDVSSTALGEAAVLAAYHSQARFSSKVPVDYTLVKNVKKPSGAKPGMVIYDNFKTIITDPDEELVRKLSIKS